MSPQQSTSKLDPEKHYNIQYYMYIIIKNNNTNVHEDMKKLKPSYISLGNKIR